MSRLSVFFVLLACSLSSCKGNQKTPPPPSVIVAAVEQRDVAIYVDAIGEVISPVTVEIRPQVNGKLISKYVIDGQMVSEGDLLYTVDPRPYQAILDEAKAQYEHDLALLEYADKTVERYKSVVENDFISKLTYEQYQSSAAAAKAQVELDLAAIQAAQINVDFCSIKAPIAGKLGVLAVDPGNIVVIDDPNAITSIKPISVIDISFSLSQQQFENIRRTQGNAGNWPFRVVLPEHPERTALGTTYFIDNQINQDTGTIFLKGRISNADEFFWPGEFVRVQVLHKVEPNTLVVPPGAVLIGKNGPYVYTVNQEGYAINHDVKVLYRGETFTAIQTSEIHAGDSVITDGQINIAPQTLVHITAK